MGDQLKPYEFKPGQSGNPSGRASLTDEEKLMRENFRRALSTLGTKSIEEIEAIAKDSTQPAAYALQAKALHWFFKKGHPGLYKELLDRTLGKVAQQIDLKGELTMRPYENLDDDALRQRITDASRRAALPPGKSEV